GAVDEYVAVARRKGDVWHLAVIGNWEPRELTLDLDFLKGAYRAEIFADGINADRDATDYTREVRTVRGGTSLTVRLSSGGGWTARLTPKKFLGLF
ncbi:MAG: glycoside hydrolase family 97 C-terminal domain-containing protein, partial [Kiritimatiellia bacterium]